MTQENSTTTTIDTTLSGRQEQIVVKIVNACAKHEGAATLHYVKTGALCETFRALYVQGGGARKDAMDILKGRLAERGLGEDISKFLKAHAMAVLLPGTDDNGDTIDKPEQSPIATLPVSVVIALLPLCSIKGEPGWTEGVNGQDVADYVTDIKAKCLPATSVREHVQHWLGKDTPESVTQKAIDKVVRAFKDIKRPVLLKAIRALDDSVFDTLFAVMEKVATEKSADVGEDTTASQEAA
jgi:hypothetical protein